MNETAGLGSRAEVVTVAGPIPADRIGRTLVHEHVLIDLDRYWDPADDVARQDPDRPVTVELLGRLRHDPTGVTRDNLRLDDPRTALTELKLFAEAGGKTIVDLTPRGTNPRPHVVAGIAAEAGVNLVVGTGYYLADTHPPELKDLDSDQIAQQFVDDLNGVDNRVRAGILGEIGTSDPIHPAERRVLQAAAQAQRATGAALNVHLREWGDNGHEILDIIEAADGDLTRVALSHLDSDLDVAYHRSLCERGAWVEYDLFGTEEYRVREGRRNPTDDQRCAALAELAEAGFADRLLISSDVCTKAQLVAFGGFGYAHVLTTVPIMLRHAGFSDSVIDKLLIDNPARLLAIE